MQAGQFQVCWIEWENNVADAFTKPLPKRLGIQKDETSVISQMMQSMEGKRTVYIVSLLITCCYNNQESRLKKSAVVAVAKTLQVL